MAKLEKTRAIIETDETYDGRVIPTEHAEIDRPVTIKEGSELEGGVYGDEVTVEANAVVNGSTLATSAIECDGGTITGDVGTPGRVTGENGEFRGSVTGKKIRLTNTVVSGNTVGNDVILENCLVCGIVAAETSLTLRNTVCYTFQSTTETTLDDAVVILPQAIIDEDPTFETPVQAIGLVVGDADDPIELTEADILTKEDNRYLTVADRLLDVKKAKSQLQDKEETLRHLVTEGGDITKVFTQKWIPDSLEIDFSSS